jgi:hypothetical protein
MNYSSYEKLLEKSMMPSLKIRRLRITAIETFKILHQSSPVFLQDLINIKNHSYNFSYIYKYSRHTKCTTCNTTEGKMVMNE